VSGFDENHPHLDGAGRRIEVARGSRIPHARAPLALGGLLGRSADSNRALSREIAQERELSLERLEHTVAERTRQLEEARRETVARLALAAERGSRPGSDSTPQGRTHPRGRASARHRQGRYPRGAVTQAGALTAHELVQVRRHAEIGARILSESTSEVLIAAEEIAHSHHERWDGSGYPLVSKAR